MFDTSSLRGRIVTKFGTLGKFADAAGCSMSFLSSYMNGKSYLDQRTMDLWVRLLEIPENEISVYFFTPKVNETCNE